MTPLIIAHRGHSKKYPENTLVAFEKALEQGADGFECDVQFSKDKKVVMHHFYTLGHTNNGEGYIFEQNATYLRSLDCGSWFAPEFRNERMPFLEEVLHKLGDKIRYEIELKGFGKEFVDAVLQIVKHYSLLGKVQFTSYQYPLLSYLKKQESNASVGLIAPPIPEWMTPHIARELIKSSLSEGIIDAVHCRLEICNPTFIDELHAT